MPKLFFPSSRPRFVNEKKVIEGLKKLALKVARKNRNVEAVYLFGSYAKGDAGLHSDADILVILAQDRRSSFKRLDEFILEFSDGPVPVDVLVCTQAELDRAVKEGNSFLAEAATGLKLVEKADLR